MNTGVSFCLLAFVAGQGRGKAFAQEVNMKPFPTLLVFKVKHGLLKLLHHQIRLIELIHILD